MKTEVSITQAIACVVIASLVLLIVAGLTARILYSYIRV